MGPYCGISVSILLLVLPLVLGDDRERLPKLPDKEGFAGAFAGVGNGVLIVAGGANFPDKKPWEGGKKVWTDRVFVLSSPTGQWAIGGKLPRRLGYGVSVSHQGTVVCVGGSDAERHYPDAFRLSWTAGQLVTTPLPPLPKPLANGCGALLGDYLYIAGGQVTPDSPPTPAVWRMNLTAKEPTWERLDDSPGRGRMLAVAAAFDGAFWLIGGVELQPGADGKLHRRYLSDAYRYTPGRGWMRVANLPRPVAAAPSPAPTNGTGFYLLGGDDGTQVGVAPDKHLGFGKQVLRYDLPTDNWINVGELSAPRVTVPCVIWGKNWVVPSGEVRPGVRSPEVPVFTPPKRE